MLSWLSLTTPLFENRGNNYIANRLVFVKYLQFWRMIVIVIKDARKMDRNITAHILYNLFHYMYLIENLFYPKIRSPVWSKEKLGYISIKETQRVDNDSSKAGNRSFFTLQVISNILFPSDFTSSNIQLRPLFCGH